MTLNPNSHIDEGLVIRLSLLKLCLLMRQGG